MKTIRILGASTLSAGILLGCSVVGIRSGYEAPPYEVLEVLSEDLEVRRYAARLAIETEVEAESREAGQSQAFRILAAYIFGENETAEEIAMTTPVESRASSTKIAMTVPVEAREREGRVRMRFFAPAAYTLETLPRPKDERIRILEAPAETLAVLRFTGLGRVAAIESRTEELLSALEGSAWSPIGEVHALFYDPPWTLPFFRRNEVSARVRARDRR
jgi:hypothetical protein